MEEPGKEKTYVVALGVAFPRMSVERAVVSH
jgi:hypothetical protein